MSQYSYHENLDKLICVIAIFRLNLFNINLINEQ